jgi:hypothetical protein
LRHENGLGHFDEPAAPLWADDGYWPIGRLQSGDSNEAMLLSLRQRRLLQGDIVS